ncbi:hypothetical protein BOX15_Mlig018696g1, partial [Macrostomum lignano]
VDLCNLRVDLCNLRVDLCNLRVDLGNLRVDLCNLRVDLANLRVDLCNLRVDLGNLRVDLGNLRVDLGNLRVDLRNLRHHLSPPSAVPFVESEPNYDDPSVTEQMLSLGFTRDQISDSLRNAKFDNVTATYLLLSGRRDGAGADGSGRALNQPPPQPQQQQPSQPIGQALRPNRSLSAKPASTPPAPAQPPVPFQRTGSGRNGAPSTTRRTPQQQPAAAAAPPSPLVFNSTPASGTPAQQPPQVPPPPLSAGGGPMSGRPAGPPRQRTSFAAAAGAAPVTFADDPTGGFVTGGRDTWLQQSMRENRTRPLYTSSAATPATTVSSTGSQQQQPRIPASTSSGPSGDFLRGLSARRTVQGTGMPERNQMESGRHSGAANITGLSVSGSAAAAAAAAAAGDNSILSKLTKKFQGVNFRQQQQISGWVLRCFL